LSIFQELDNPIATESALWDESNWDESKWGTDDLVKKILEELNKKKRKKIIVKMRSSQIRQ
jgi:hypothetical protein